MTKTMKTKANMTSQKKDKSGTDKSTVTNDKLYEGLICLDVKLSKLIDIMDKLYTIAEQKQTGGCSALKTTSKN